MSIFNFFRANQRKSVADEAKERLQIVLAHERAAGSSPDYLPMLQKELLAVIAKYVSVDENKVEVSFERGGDCSTLEVNIELPPPAAARSRAAGGGAARRPA
ncbi:cell division topological specificity factor MinE [Arenibaculum sp.]|jgi:cell division topological specificity factor|uniref:cell division topological specificity factor MinE n=1 Tax=Arenibaculum sp. TaxID=2865862 RepID=UPI002E0E5B39|nr:cell division topological specificity factor MinE [Arenibaculum sp.]